MSFTSDGLIEHVSKDVPKVDAPWIHIQKKEYHRLCVAFNLVRRTLSEDEQKEHRRESYRKYRQRIAHIRELMGKPLVVMVPGRSAPRDAVNRVVELLGQINPGTGALYTGVEIALLTQLSASSVSRIRNGQRHGDARTARGGSDSTLS
jgi:hypothetical protein